MLGQSRWLRVGGSQGIDAPVAGKRDANLGLVVSSHPLLDFFLNVDEASDFGYVVLGFLALRVFGEVGVGSR